MRKLPHGRDAVDCFHAPRRRPRFRMFRGGGRERGRTQSSILDAVMRKISHGGVAVDCFHAPRRPRPRFAGGCFEQDDENEDEHRTIQRLR